LKASDAQNGITRDGREQIGMAITVALARRALLAATSDNQFLLTHTRRTAHRDCNHPLTRSTQNVD